uniref:Uncharacterized protein n=1 Tax=Oryza brachyantha TaxID=4533 RepID=J3MA31_ORYBR
MRSSEVRKCGAATRRRLVRRRDTEKACAARVGTCDVESWRRHAWHRQSVNWAITSKAVLTRKRQQEQHLQLEIISAVGGGARLQGVAAVGRSAAEVRSVSEQETSRV